MRLIKYKLPALLGIIALFIMFVVINFFFGNRFIRNESELNKCKNNVIINYDVIDFVKLTNSFEDNNYQDLLPYSLKMMDSCGIANYYFYETYLQIRFSKNFRADDITKLDKPEQDYLIYILLKGAKAEDDYCREKLIDYYKKGIVVEKNSIVADSLQKTVGISKRIY